MAPRKKKVIAIVKIQLPAGGATPAPPVGTALGPHGIQTMEFCKQYNAATDDKKGSIIPVEISIYEDRSFSFILKTPPTTALIKEAVGLQKASQTPGRDIVARLTPEQVTAIAKVKLSDLNAYDLHAAEQQVAGTARSMGIAVTA